MNTHMTSVGIHVNSYNFNLLVTIFVANIVKIATNRKVKV